MMITTYDFPLPNNGERYDLSHYEYSCLKHKFFELIAQKTGEEYLKTVEEKIQYYGELEK